MSGTPSSQTMEGALFYLSLTKTTFDVFDVEDLTMSSTPTFPFVTINSASFQTELGKALTNAGIASGEAIHAKVCSFSSCSYLNVYMQKYRKK